MLNQQDQFIINFGKFIGKGKCGIVYSSTRNNQNGQSEECCVRVINNHRYGLEKMLGREIEIMKSLNVLQNPNLVNCFHITSYQHEIRIFMEICDGGDLSSVIKQKKGIFSTEEATDIVKQVTNGYKSLLSIKLIHRDLKPANILRTKNGTYKIADFGMSRFIDDIEDIQKQDKHYHQGCRLGFPRWSAPQIILYDKGQYTAKADIYSLGIIFYNLLFNQYPGNIRSFSELIMFQRKIESEPLKCPIDNNVPEITRNLVERMLQFTEQNRIGWEELIQIFSQEDQIGI